MKEEILNRINAILESMESEAPKSFVLVFDSEGKQTFLKLNASSSFSKTVGAMLRLEKTLPSRKEIEK